MIPVLLCQQEQHTIFVSYIHSTINFLMWKDRAIGFEIKGHKLHLYYFETILEKERQSLFVVDVVVGSGFFVCFCFFVLLYWGSGVVVVVLFLCFCFVGGC